MVITSKLGLFSTRHYPPPLSWSVWYSASHELAQVTGIGGLLCQSVVHFSISSSHSRGESRLRWHLRPRSVGCLLAQHNPLDLMDRSFLTTLIYSQGDELLQKFWEVEERNFQDPVLSPEEMLVVKHFQETHCHDENGKFIVPLPRKPDAQPLGESHTQAV